MNPAPKSHLPPGAVMRLHTQKQNTVSLDGKRRNVPGKNLLLGFKALQAGSPSQNRREHSFRFHVKYETLFPTMRQQEVIAENVLIVQSCQDR